MNPKMFNDFSSVGAEAIARALLWHVPSGHSFCKKTLACISRMEQPLKGKCCLNDYRSYATQSDALLII